MTETDEEIKFGDKMVLDFTRDENGKMVHRHLDCYFIPEMLPYFLKNEVVYCKEMEDVQEGPKEHKENYSTKELEDRIIYLEGKVADLEKAIETNIKNIAYLFGKGISK